jgi:hypothetical protein
LAHPQYPRWDATNNCHFWDVFQYQSSGPHYSSVTDLDTFKHNGIGPNPDVVPNVNGLSNVS